jgi:hypothetical protein
MQRSLSPGLNVVYLVAGGPDGARDLALTFAGTAARVLGLERSGPIAAANLAPRPLTAGLPFVAQEIDALAPHATAPAGADLTVRLSVRNPTSYGWSPHGTHGVHLIARWDGGPAEAHALPPIGPGVTAFVDLRVRAPAAGPRVLHLTAAQRRSGVFTERGARGISVAIAVTPTALR